MAASANAEVKIRFTGEIKQLIADLEKARKEMSKIGEEDLSDGLRKQFQAVQSDLDNVKSKADQALTGLTSGKVDLAGLEALHKLIGDDIVAIKDFTGAMQALSGSGKGIETLKGSMSQLAKLTEDLAKANKLLGGDVSYASNTDKQIADLEKLLSVEKEVAEYRKSLSKLSGEPLDDALFQQEEELNKQIESYKKLDDAQRRSLENVRKMDLAVSKSRAAESVALDKDVWTGLPEQLSDNSKIIQSIASARKELIKGYADALKIPKQQRDTEGLTNWIHNNKIGSQVSNEVQSAISNISSGVQVKEFDFKIKVTAEGAKKRLTTIIGELQKIGEAKPVRVPITVTSDYKTGNEKEAFSEELTAEKVGQRLAGLTDKTVNSISRSVKQTINTLRSELSKEMVINPTIEVSPANLETIVGQITKAVEAPIPIKIETEGIAGDLRDQLGLKETKRGNAFAPFKVTLNTSDAQTQASNLRKYIEGQLQNIRMPQISGLQAGSKEWTELEAVYKKMLSYSSTLDGRKFRSNEGAQLKAEFQKAFGNYLTAGGKKEATALTTDTKLAKSLQKLSAGVVSQQAKAQEAAIERTKTNLATKMSEIPVNIRITCTPDEINTCRRLIYEGLREEKIPVEVEFTGLKTGKGGEFTFPISPKINDGELVSQVGTIRKEIESQLQNLKVTVLPETAKASKLWSSVEKEFNTGLAKSSDFNLAKIGKKQRAAIEQAFAQYKNAGGVRSFYDLTDDAKIASKLESKIASKITSGNMQSQLASVEQIEARIRELNNIKVSPIDVNLALQEVETIRSQIESKLKNLKITFNAEPAALENQWKSLEKTFGSILSKSPTFDLRSLSSKDLAPLKSQLLEQYKQYKYLGGMQSLSDLSKDKKISKKLNNLTPTIDNAWSKNQVQSLEQVKEKVLELSTALAEMKQSMSLDGKLLDLSQLKFTKGNVENLERLADALKHVSDSIKMFAPGSSQLSELTTLMNQMKELPNLSNVLKMFQQESGTAAKTATTATTKTATKAVGVDYLKQASLIEAKLSSQYGKVTSMPGAEETYGRVLTLLREISSVPVEQQAAKFKEIQAAAAGAEQEFKRLETIQKTLYNSAFKKTQGNVLSVMGMDPTTKLDGFAAEYEKLIVAFEKLRGLQSQMTSMTPFGEDWNKNVNQMYSMINQVNEMAKKLQNPKWNLTSSTLGQFKVGDTKAGRDEMYRIANSMNGQNTQLIQGTNSVEKLVFSYKDLENQMHRVTLAADSMTGSIVKSGDRVTQNQSSLAKSIETIGTKIKTVSAYWIAFYANPMMAIHYFKQIIDYVKELDSALTELRVVSNASDGELSSIAKQSYEVAQAVGSTTTDIVSSVTDWRRLGESVSDSMTLAQQAAALSTGGLMSVDVATDTLTSAMHAYGYEVEDVYKIVDQFIYMGELLPVCYGNVA